MPDWVAGVLVAVGTTLAVAAFRHREWVARETAAHLVMWADAIAYRQAAIKRRKEVKSADEDRVD